MANGSSKKEWKAVNNKEERKDYPEVTPTAMSNSVCDRCGKSFQNQNDIYQHQKFERKNYSIINCDGKSSYNNANMILS